MTAFAAGFAVGAFAIDVQDALDRVKPQEPLALLWIDPQGNLGLRIPAEAVVFNPEAPPDGISHRCRTSVMERPYGTRTVVCVEDDSLWHSVNPDL